jgi:drug/metabolite transporter (DMT)-like permease
MLGRTTFLPSVAIALAAVSWGCWWIPLRALESRGLSASFALLALYGCSALVLLPTAVARWGHWRDRAWDVAVLGILYGSQLTIWSYAIIVGEVIRVTLLFYLAPVWGTLLAVGALRERLTSLRTMAVVFGIVGAVTVLGLESGSPLPRSGADWLGLWAGFQFALATTYSRWRADTGGIESIFATFACSAVTAITILALVPVEAMPTGVDIAAALPILAAAVVLLVVPSYWLVLWAASRLDPGRVATLLLLEVLAAAVSASILTDEPFGWRELAGCAMIVVAGLVSALDQMWQGRAVSAARVPGQR